MGKHAGSPAPDEDEPVPFWPAKPVGIKNVAVKIYPGEPTTPCALCADPIKPRRDVYYSDGKRSWCDRHGISYSPGRKG